MRHHSRGFVLVTMVASTAVLLGIVGLAIDIGYLELLKLRMQTAADAAAVGGVQEFRMNGASSVTAAARADAAANGFTNGANAVSVTVNHPPSGGFSTADPTAVEVIITRDAGTMFLSALGLTSATIKARSVARQGSSTNCMYTLDPAGADALSVANGVAVTSSCGVVVDSTNAKALTASGGAKLTASSIAVAGNYKVTNGATVSPAPATGAATGGDPLAYIPAPSVGGCTANNTSIGGNTTTTISQGVYCGGITIGNGANVTLNPGTYILVGGGLNFGGGATVTGSGVTFYNTYDAQHPYSSIQMNNGVSVTLSAPTTGPLAGVLMFQDRSVAGGAASAFSGGASLKMTGALYFPTTALQYYNGASAPYTIVVAKTISFAGGVKINNDYSSLPGGSPVKGGAALSE